MESNVLTNIPGIEYYPIVSLLIFVLVFAGLLVWYFRADKKRLSILAEAMLADDRSFAEDESSESIHKNYA